MKITTNFSKSEFDCHDGSEMPDEVLAQIGALAYQLQKIRDHFDAPVKINSGYRSPTYNTSIGGAKHSQHKLGKAADIVVSGVNPDDVADAIEKMMEDGTILQGGLGRYNSFTHVDIRGTEARWDNR
jgi:uncharacterized protein YcbK (DUF882 family)